MEFDKPCPICGRLMATDNIFCSLVCYNTDQKNIIDLEISNPDGENNG